MTLSELYQPLDSQRREIRLLRILPSTELKAPVHCCIFTASLTDDPPPIYQALSYAWGDPKLTDEITIQGTEGPTTVGLSLSLAIRYIRHDSNDVVLWADALCINQNDIQERGHQVRMMGFVYNNAKEVIAWLGEEEDDTQIAMELVQRWAKFKEIPDPFKELEGQAFGAAMLGPVQEIVPMALDSRADLALDALADRPYWTRAWLYQELSLAKNVVIQSGRMSNTLECFLKASLGFILLSVLYVTGDVLTESVSFLKIQTRPMVHMLSLVNRSRSMRPFSLKILPLEMLDSFKSLKVTDPKDKVFALLGFVALDGPFPDLITANYTKTTEQVYLDVARYLILTEQTLHVLNQRHSRPSIGCQRSMPTWVPDWQTGTTNKWISHRNDSDKEEAVVSSNLVSQLVDFSPDGKLLAKGFEVDVVSDVFNNGLFPFWNGPEGSNPYIAFQNFAKCILSGPLVQKETTLSAYFRLAIYNNLKDHNEPDPHGHRFFKDAATFLRYIFMKIQTGNVFPPGSFMANNVQIWPFTLVMAFLGTEAAQAEKERLVNLVLDEDLETDFYDTKFTVIHAGHLLFRTESGSLGLGPEGMAKGDALCHLAAHPNPFLLRPAGPRYTNVGDCNVLDLALPDVVEELVPSMRVFEIE